MIDFDRGILMDSQTVFVLTVIWFCVCWIVDFGLFLANCFGWMSFSWGWYPLIALIGIVPVFGMFFYVLANIMKEAP